MIVVYVRGLFHDMSLTDSQEISTSSTATSNDLVDGVRGRTETKLETEKVTVAESKSS